MNSAQNSPEQPQPADPRLQSTPDYGTLGPGSDIALGGPEAPAAGPVQPTRPVRFGPFIAIAAGVLAAVLVGNVHSAGAAWQHLADLFSVRAVPEPQSTVSTSASPKDLAHLDRLKPQKQAETLLELAVGNSDGAVDQISSRVDRWHGKVSWNPQLANLTTAALNSNDMRVRESGLEVQLVAYGLSKNPLNIDVLVQDADSPDHARKIWALWSLGAMANRGVEPDRVVEVLTTHLKDSDEDSRRWTVEALALVGTNPTIPLLLQTLHDDPSPLVRERAACSLAESGMLTHQQRLAAVPQLLSYSDDPSLDAQTHAWAFQALADITGQRLPHDSTAWRNWYASSRAE
ncbi:MAG: HEAT repeat domain-containing protein [Acidobacteriia bacterium]|nr:HEAT repeat domain-containing protein [Terriglobia bacterium]